MSMNLKPSQAICHLFASGRRCVMDRGMTYDYEEDIIGTLYLRATGWDRRGRKYVRRYAAVPVLTETGTGYVIMQAGTEHNSATMAQGGAR